MMRAFARFSVENPVLVNMLMLAIIVGGIFSALTMVREMFPEFREDRILITTIYPGASPADVERGVSRRIEEEIKTIRDIEKIETTIAEGVSTIAVTLTRNVRDLDDKVNEFKVRIDAIPRSELPQEVEQSVITKFEPQLPVIAVSLFGPADEPMLKRLGEQLRDDILRLPSVTNVTLSGVRRAEIAVDVDPARLIQYGLSLAQVSEAIRRSNLDLPGGQIRTAAQNIALRTMGETDDAVRIEQTIVSTLPDGSIIRLADVATVREALEESDLSGRFNGQPAVTVLVTKTPDQDAVQIAAEVKAFVAGKLRTPLPLSWWDRILQGLGHTPALVEIHRQSALTPLPDGMRVETHSNLARFIESRLDLLTRNALSGMILVFASLLITLNWRFAFWVMLGVLFSICGTLVFMQLLGGVSLNLISMFGLIIVLGILVDDAIVIGENIYARIEAGEAPALAAINGTAEVGWPVLIAVATTIGAFLPLMFIDGRIGDFMGILPVVVAIALAVSMVESVGVLPSHLAESLKPHNPADPRPLSAWRPRRWWDRTRQAIHTRFMDGYTRFIHACVVHRYATVCVALSVVIVCIGLIQGKRTPFVFVQKMDAETSLVNLEMPVDTPAHATEAMLRRIEAFVLADPDVRSVQTIIGGSVSVGDAGATAQNAANIGQLMVELTELNDRSPGPDGRPRDSEQIIQGFRTQTADLAGYERLRFEQLQGGPQGREIEIQIVGDNLASIRNVSESIQRALAAYGGVFDIGHDYESGRPEFQVTLRDSAHSLGITREQVYRELRGAFFGYEPRTLQRAREDVKIRVRFPPDQRNRLDALESLRIATPSGQMVPLSEIAIIEQDRGPSTIRRLDQRRSITVTADVDQARANTQEITQSLEPTLAGLRLDNPDVQIRYSGSKLETMKSMGSLAIDFPIALLIIFVLLAGLFKSYVQPLIVMCVIPMGITGAVLGHLIMGYPLTMLSMIGLVALSGIVVNDSLVLVDLINRRIAAGEPLVTALVQSSKRRLRPIFLTSITTILGLAPLLTETSFQARFLIPMAISITFGLAATTFLTLILVPTFFHIVHDLRNLGRWILTGSVSTTILPRQHAELAQLDLPGAAEQAHRFSVDETNLPGHPPHNTPSS